MTISTSNSPPSANTLRSIVAVLAGIVIAVASPTLTDLVLYRTGVFPRIGEPMADNLFYLAAAYRLVYSVLGSYVIARLAPNRPMFHAMIAGFLGLLASSAGTVATWNHVPPLGPHWYSLSLVVTALPCAWLGGKLRLMQLSKSANVVNRSAV